MRTRIARRKHGKGNSAIYACGATHVIKIGFDARKKGASHPFPGKLPGFLICRDSIGQDGQRVVDHGCMKNLGEQYTPEAIAAAKKDQLKSPEGLLPTEVHFVLPYDAVLNGDSWDFPSTFAEAYETWDKGGLFCTGDGHKASRKQDGGNREIIDCVPAGSEGAKVKEFCPYSVKEQYGCKAHSRLLLCLFTRGADGKPIPLSDALGWQARYRFDTSSENCGPNVVAELDKAAKRLEGRLSGITGSLSYMIQKKRYNKGVGITGQVRFALNEQDISERETMLFNRRLQVNGTMLLGAPETAPGQVDAHDPFESNESTKASEVVDAEAVPPADEGESPFDDDPPANGPMRVADASDEDLADALAAFSGDKFQEIATFQHEGKTHSVPNINWFFEGSTPENELIHLKILREICLRLEATPDTHFAILPCKEATE